MNDYQRLQVERQIEEAFRERFREGALGLTRGRNGVSVLFRIRDPDIPSPGSKRISGRLALMSLEREENPVWRVRLDLEKAAGPSGDHWYRLDQLREDTRGSLEFVLDAILGWASDRLEQPFDHR